VIPMPSVRVQPGQSALFFPLIGAWLGWFSAAMILMLQMAVPAQLATLLVVAFWVAITGGLHEDGLADTADAFAAGRSTPQILEILKDSRIGTFGALAVVLSILLRWQALAGVSTPFVPALVASQAVPRAAMVVLAWVSRPVGTGLGAAFCSTLSTPVALLAAGQGIAALLWCGLKAGLWMLAGTAIILVLAHRYFHRKIGGVTGDCLGATSQAVEIFLLLLLSCVNCIS
jgi:adenosylcobinamide-GDP ribazoletransferase